MDTALAFKVECLLSLPHGTDVNELKEELQQCVITLHYTDDMLVDTFITYLGKNSVDWKKLKAALESRCSNLERVVASAQGNYVISHRFYTLVKKKVRQKY